MSQLPTPYNTPHPHMVHTVDVIRHKRDGMALEPREIQHMVTGAAKGTIPPEQLSAWLMACCIRGLSVDETRALTVAMRDSGETFSPKHLNKIAVDKHSTGGVGDKTSFLVAPMAAACGVAVPMISGRALGHTGGTLDKLESIPGYKTMLPMVQFERILQRCGASIIGQTPELVPADRTLYAMRDRTATVEHPGLICASILSKKLAAGLDALVLDVKTGSGAFLRRREDASYLAALLVATAESAGTRTVALMTDMGQPLGATAGNWIEVAESAELLRGRRPAGSEDLRRLSLILAGWMIHLGGKAITPEAGFDLAEASIADGSAWRAFLAMIEAHGGDISIFDNPVAHRPATCWTVTARQSGFIANMETTKIGWAVQRLGAGREKAGEPVDPHAGIRFHVHRGSRVEEDQPIATLYATASELLEEPVDLLEEAILIAPEQPAPVPLVSRIFTRRDAEEYLLNHRT